MTERTLVYMDVGDLLSRFHPQNPKLHSVDELRRSMARFGYAESVILDERTGLLAAGHGRVEVLSADEKAGAKPPEGIAVADGKWQVPVQRGWASKDDSEARAYLIASNRLVETGGWDDGGLAAMLQSISETDLGLAGIGYDDAQLADLLAGLRRPSPKNPDAVPSVPKTPVSKLGDVWLLGDHRVMCGDSTIVSDVEKLMDGAKADMVFTDPPYGINLQTDYGKVGHGQGRTYAPLLGDDGMLDLSVVMTTCAGVTEQFWWGADYYRGVLPSGGTWMVWDKRANDDGMELDNLFGSVFELCWSRQLHRRQIARVLWAMSHGRKDEDSNGLHPTQKPVRLATWFSSSDGARSATPCSTSSAVLGPPSSPPTRPDGSPTSWNSIPVTRTSSVSGLRSFLASLQH